MEDGRRTFRRTVVRLGNLGGSECLNSSRRWMAELEESGRGRTTVDCRVLSGRTCLGPREGDKDARSALRRLEEAVQAWHSDIRVTYGKTRDLWSFDAVRSVGDNAEGRRCGPYMLKSFVDLVLLPSYGFAII